MMKHQVSKQKQQKKNPNLMSKRQTFLTWNILKLVHEETKSSWSKFRMTLTLNCLWSQDVGNIFDLFIFYSPPTVTEAPRPKLTPVTQVAEGAQVRLQCSVPVPCPSLPPSITWLLGTNSIDSQNQRHYETFMAKVWVSWWGTRFLFFIFYFF